MLDAPGEGARRYFVAGDFKCRIEVFLAWETSTTLNDIYGPQCPYCIQAHPGVLKKAVWLEILTEFDDRALSSQRGRGKRRT